MKRIILSALFSTGILFSTPSFANTEATVNFCTHVVGNYSLAYYDRYKVTHMPVIPTGDNPIITKISEKLLSLSVKAISMHPNMSNAEFRLTAITNCISEDWLRTLSK